MTDPEQYRAIADEGDARADYTHARTPETIHRLTAALRAAADQLEAVQDVELVAAAIYGSQRPTPSWDTCPPERRNQVLRQARAVVALTAAAGPQETHAQRGGGLL